MITSAELARVAGITDRKVQLWDERGIIKPRRRRPFGRRFFDDDQIFKALIVRELRARGITLKKIRRLKLIPVKGDYLLIVRPQGHGECKRDRTIRIGNRVKWADSESLIGHTERVHSPVLLISINDLREEFYAAMEAIRSVRDSHERSVSAMARRTGVMSAAPPLRRSAA